MLIEDDRDDLLAADIDAPEPVDGVDGFTSMCSREALATVCWMAVVYWAPVQVDPVHPGAMELPGVRERVREWPRRKHDLLTDHHIEIAWDHLHDEQQVAA